MFSNATFNKKKEKTKLLAIVLMLWAEANNYIMCEKNKNYKIRQRKYLFIDV